MKKLETSSINEALDAPSAVAYSDVQRMIVHVRNQQVIIDADVAKLYGVETKHINQAVRNNRDKFPIDYVFALTSDEASDLRSKFLTANISSKSRALPKAFTEKGLYMLATVLKAAAQQKPLLPSSKHSQLPGDAASSRVLPQGGGASSSAIMARRDAAPPCAVTYCNM